MKLLRFEYQGAHSAGVLTERGVVPVSEINARLGSRMPDEVLAIIQSGDQSGDLEPLRHAGSIPAIPLRPGHPDAPLRCSA